MYNGQNIDLTFCSECFSKSWRNNMYFYEFKQKHLLCTHKLDLVVTLLYHLSSHNRINMLYIVSISQLFIKSSCMGDVQAQVSFSQSISMLCGKITMTARMGKLHGLCGWMFTRVHIHTKAAGGDWFNLIGAEGRSFLARVVTGWGTKAVCSERTRVWLFHSSTVLLYAHSWSSDSFRGGLKPGGAEVGLLQA